jgi:hypothetical protein
MDQTCSERTGARRQRRIAAGRSGGVFELVRDGDGSINYQYAQHVSPSSGAYDAVSHQACAASTESLASSQCSTSSDTESEKANVLVRYGGRATGDKDKTCDDIDAARKNWTFMGTKTVAAIDSVNLVTTKLEPGTKNGGKSRRALKKIKNKFVSGIVQHHRKKTIGKEDNKTVDTITNTNDLNIEKSESLPFTPTHQVRRSSVQIKTPSPVKAQLALEADRDVRNVEVDKEFFTPPRMTKIPTGRQSTESVETDIFG